jgi:DNA polymerase-4
MLRSLFVDFNSYFASVEQQVKPHLRGKPVGVLPVMAPTTCCIAASYEAKAFGVKTGTSVQDARRLCPEIVFIEAKHDIYVDFHQRCIAAVERVAPVRQVLSIDEMECELTGSWRQRDKAITIAQNIKKEILSTVGVCLRCSIGIAPNTLLGKLASDMQKPDGLVVIEQDELPGRLHGLKLSDVQGIGKRMLERLQAAGIFSMAELCAAPRDVLHSVWGGVAGSEMHDMLRGQWYGPRATTARSLGHSHVLPPELRNPQGALGVLMRLTQKAAMRLRKQGFYATGMSISLRCNHRCQTQPETSKDGRREAQFGQKQDTGFFLDVLHTLWHSGLQALQNPKAVNVTMHGLVLVGQHTPDLFDFPKAPATASPATKGRGNLDAAMDKLNRTYGKNTLYFAASHAARDTAPMRIAFNRIPDLETEV